MKSFIQFKDLVIKLTAQETSSSISYLRIKNKGTDNIDPKGILLVKLILKKPEITSIEASRKIYKKVSIEAFEKLVHRTKASIFECMLYDIQLEKYSARTSVVFRMRKKILLCEVLNHRDMNSEFEIQLTHVISKCKKYEIYDILIHALRLKQRHFSYIHGEKKYQQIEKEILFYDENLKASIRARSIFTKIGAKLSRKYLPFVYAEIEEAIGILKLDFEATSSSFVGYYFMLLMVEWHHVHDRYAEAGVILNQLLELVTTKAGVYTKDRHADVLMNIANNEILKKDFESAIKYSIISTKFKHSSITNFNTAREIEFYARFYNGELDEAGKIIEEIYHSTRTINTPFLYSKRAYLLACLKTIKGSIRESNVLLTEVKEIDKDKEGWNLGKRILAIINCIDADETDSVDLKVLSLEKFIKRIIKSRTVRKRNILILRILLKLINEGFDFAKVYQKRKKYFDLLESNDGEYAWKIKSPELIVFHEWFRKKIDSKKALRTA
jgi:hypothetical protein